MTMSYRASSALALSLASLGHSTSLTAGQCSAAYSNTSNLDDFLLPTLKLRAGTGTLTGNGPAELWAFTQRADGTWPELFTGAYTGADGAFTVVSRDILFAGAVSLGVVTMDTTASRHYVLRGFELAQRFGAMPEQVAFFFTHNSGQPLSTTAGDHVLSLKSGKFE